MGGNNVTNSQVMNETYEYYEERLSQLISYIKMENVECDIFICNMCPRSDKKMLELINGNTQPEKVAELVMDAFKLLSLNIKLTNMNKLERVKKELHAKYVPLCEEGPSDSKLLGDNFQEQAKMLESTKQSLTKNALPALFEGREKQSVLQTGTIQSQTRTPLHQPKTGLQHTKQQCQLQELAQLGKKNLKLNRKLII